MKSCRGLVFLLVVVAGLGGCSRSYKEAQSSALGSEHSTFYRQPSTYDQAVQRQESIPEAVGSVGGVPGGVAFQQDKKIVRSAELALLVNDVDEASAKIRNLALQQNGEIDQVREWSPSERTREGELHVRVPADKLEAALKQIKSVAISVSNERLVATDVTRQYTDNAARMHSLQAEEQQYLQILKQAKSIQDILDVTEHLTEVRTQIEQLQGEINVMSHDIAMSAVAIMLSQNAPEGGLLGSWHPLLNARRSVRSMIEGLGDWADSAIAFAIYLPLLALWILSICLILWIAWKILRYLWRHRKAS